MTERRTDGQTDESDFTGRCPTDVEHPIRHYQTPLGFMLVYLETRLGLKTTFTHFPPIEYFILFPNDNIHLRANVV